MKCSCQHCGNHIEFDDSRLGQTVACPHCNLETKLIAPDAKTSESDQPNGRSQNTNVELKQGAYALGIASLILGIIACVFYWTPFLEPFFLWIAIVGLSLALAGLIMARINNKTGFVFPIIGLVICLTPLVVDATIIGGSVALHKITDWRAQRAAHKQELADAKARLKAYQHNLPIRVQTQVQAYLLDLQNIADAESRLKVCQTNIVIEQTAVNDAQQQFNEVKAEYDGFMATNSFTTNAAYLKLSHQLNLLLQQRNANEQSILTLQQDIEEKSARPSVLPYDMPGPYGGPRLQPNPAAYSTQAQIRQDEIYLQAAQANIPVLNQKIAAVQQQLNETAATLAESWQNNLDNAKVVLDTAASRLTEAQTRLAAANQQLIGCKKQAESDLAAAKSVLDEERSTAF